jgi:hypothetical protein
MREVIQAAIVAFVSVIIAFGCATERQIAPEIQSAPRPTFDLKPPVLGAVFDGRSNQDNKEAAARLEADLTRIYGPSIQWTDYFSKTQPGKVSIRIRLVTLGASFGSRLISMTTFSSAAGSARLNATGPWGPVVGTISADQTVLGAGFSGEGWWNGAAWIDLEIEDRRGEVPMRFTVPIAAEHQESNMWGYASGDKAARVAWDRVATQLTRALDSILRNLRDQGSADHVADIQATSTQACGIVTGTLLYLSQVT